ncbi:hypothetical protein HHL19_28250 [Streptomyces sp. R302]|uniref:hypothetical protein n=1 Tax=unclassified Streptomyces TaxID=2593676 RepID=UPI00145C4329|nr:MULTISPECIES: hypothetical protein [unclassified Streptomyces]NML52094.1 hypothetical protein [Streptomyces sp. R301]NML82440.1 hypothetical protein [Streptomyces sp. R302]
MSRAVGLLLPEEARARRDEPIALCAQAFGGAPWHEPPLGAVRTADRLPDSAARRPDFRAEAALGPVRRIMAGAAASAGRCTTPSWPGPAPGPRS